MGRRLGEVGSLLQRVDKQAEGAFRHKLKPWELPPLTTSAWEPKVPDCHREIAFLTKIVQFYENVALPAMATNGSGHRHGAAYESCCNKLVLYYSTGVHLRSTPSGLSRVRVLGCRLSQRLQCVSEVTIPRGQ